MKKLFSVGKLVTKLSLEEQFRIAKEAGFEGVDYILAVNDLWIKPRNVCNMSKTYDIPIYGVHVPLLFIPFLPPFLYTKLLDTLEIFRDLRIFNLHLSCFINPFQKNEKALSDFVMKAVSKDISMSFESNPSHSILNHYPKETYNPEQFAQFCQKNNLSMNFDTSHIATRGYDIISFFKKYHRNITVIHMSDYGKGIQHLAAGEGVLPLKQLIQEMKRVSFNGTVIFELYKFPTDVTNEKRLSLIKNSLEHVNY